MFIIIYRKKVIKYSNINSIVTLIFYKIIEKHCGIVYARRVESVILTLTFN